jgi:hypothetical protein
MPILGGIFAVVAVWLYATGSIITSLVSAEHLPLHSILVGVVLIVAQAFLAITTIHFLLR